MLCHVADFFVNKKIQSFKYELDVDFLKEAGQMTKIEDNQRDIGELLIVSSQIYMILSKVPTDFKKNVKKSSQKFNKVIPK